MTPSSESTEPVPFGLQRRPFQPTADPDFFFPGGQAGDALDRLVTALRARRGACILTGDTGTGKTTVLRTVLVNLAAGGGLLPLAGNAPMGLDDLMGLLGESATAAADSPEAQVEHIRRRLRQLADEGRPVVLAIDEAQALGEDMLGHVTGLLGRATGDHALGSLLLVGQPTLAGRLKPADEGGPEIAVRCSLGLLPVGEVEAYIAHRMSRAGADAARVFAPAALDRIAHLSGGAPRFVNLLCHEALAIAARRGASRVEPEVVDDVAEDLAFPGFVPRPRPPAISATASRSISRRAAWAGAGVGAAAAVSLAILFGLPRGERPPRGPEPRSPALAASTGRTEPAPAGAPAESHPAPQEAGPAPASGPSSEPSPTDAPAMITPPPERRADAPNTTPPPRHRAGPSLLQRAESGDLPGVLALLAAGESPDIRDQAGVTPLMLAAIHGDAIMSDALLQRGAPVNARNRTGQTALMMAAINNNMAVAQRLLDRGASVNARTTAGWTALTYAAWEGRPEIARLLLERGADPGLRDRDGWTPERYAVWRLNPPPPESGGPVTGIDDVESSLPANPGHAAVLDILTEAARLRRDQASSAGRRPGPVADAPSAVAPSSSPSTEERYPLDSSGTGHGLKVPHRGEP